MSPPASVWPPRIAALALSAAAALSAVYWGLHWRLPASPDLAGPGGASAGQLVDSEAVARALGASGSNAMPAPMGSASTADASRFVLLGVLGNAQGGSALIAVDGKPPKPVRVGATVAEGWTLRQARDRRAVLSQGSTELELTLPALPAPAILDKKAP